MVPRRRLGREGLLQHGPAFVGAGALGGLTGREVPHPPGRLGHDRLGEHRAHVAVVAMGPEHLAHGVGEGAVPAGHVVDRRTLRIALGQCSDQRALGRRRMDGGGQRLLRGVVGGRQRRGLAAGIHQLPRQVVVGTRGIGDAPMRHRAGGIVLERPFEAADRFLVIVGVGPDQAAIDPELGFGRGRGDGAAVAAEIIVVVHGGRIASCSSPPPALVGAPEGFHRRASRV